MGGYGRPDGLIREPWMEGKGKKKQGADEDGGGITDNALLRSGKGSLYEGGTREPFVVRWPGVTKPGTVVNEIMSNEDWLPTFAAAAGDPDVKRR